MPAVVRSGNAWSARAAAVSAVAILAVMPFAAKADDCPVSPPPTAPTAPNTVQVGGKLDGACAPVQPGLTAIRPSSIAGRLYTSGSGDTGIYVNANDCHIFTAPAGGAQATNKLFLFIDGTNSTPAAYQQILLEAASKGYYAVSIGYPNNEAVGAWCNSRPAPASGQPIPASYTNCSEDMRREIILGYSASDPAGTTIDSDGAAVDVRNSIQQRVNDFLRDQINNSSDPGWANFISNGKVDWTKVVVAGHSQGSGHALYVSKLFTVNRMVIFSGVSDRATDDTTNMAPWLTRNSSWKTAPGAMYAFVEDGDTYVNPADNPAPSHPCSESQYEGTYPTQSTAVFDHNINHCQWSYDGWYAAHIATDTGKGNSYSHVFTAYNKPQVDSPICHPGLANHGATVADGATPSYVDSGQTTQFVYAPIWDTIAFPTS